MKRAFPLLATSLVLLLAGCKQSESGNKVSAAKEQGPDGKPAASAPAGEMQGKAGELYPILQDKKWGYMDSTGKVAIAPKYLRASRFFDDLALVADDNNKIGYINREGKMAIEPKFDAAAPFHEGYAAAFEGTKAGLINKKGDWVLSPGYVRIGKFSGGLAPAVIVRSRGEIQAEDGGYIDPKGNFVIAPQFDPGLTSFNEDLAGVRRVGQLWSFIDRSGKTVIPPKWFGVGQFAEGLAGAMEEKSKWGFIDKTGTWVVTPKFKQVRFFSEGLAGVQTLENPKWGYVDRKGEMVIKAQFDGVDQFLDGIAMVQVGSKIAYINKSGQFVRQPTE